MPWWDTAGTMETEPRSIVVVVRAWEDDGGIRGRVVLENKAEDIESIPAASIEELCETACLALQRWSQSI